VYVGILVVVIVATLGKLGVQTASIIAGVGAMGLGVGGPAGRAGQFCRRDIDYQ